METAKCLHLAGDIASLKGLAIHVSPVLKGLAIHGSPVLLDLSAVFDTVDHELLQNIMSSRFGLSGRVQQWLQSYLSGRT